MRFKREVQIKKYQLLLIFTMLSSLFLFFGVTELILHLINYSYVPPDFGFEITPDYELFENISGICRTKENKIDIFQNQSFTCTNNLDEYRIFVVGGSSIHGLGDLYSLNFSLSQKYPFKKFKIINIGGKGYGTMRLFLHFKEIMNYNPDLIILYSGHNEFEEQFVRDSFFQESFLSDIDDYLLLHSKLYQFVSFGINKISKKFLLKNIDLIKSGKHPFFPPDLQIQWGISLDKKKVYSTYKNNILNMILLAKQNSIPLIISTVAYNRMIPPFKPKNNLYDSCLEELNDSKFEDVLTCLSDALDLDLQPHRASKTSNEIVMQLAKQYNIPLADVDAKIISIAKNGIPGNDIFFDHCHLNDNGSEIMEDVFFETIINNKLIEEK